MKRMITNSTERKFLSFEELAQLVANYFTGIMKEEDFDTFEEMKQCYWWTPNEIKDEVDAVIREASDERSYIDELDRSDVFSGDAMMPYRQFASMWRKIVKAHEKANEGRIKQ